MIDQLELTQTDIQGMMTGNFSTGTKKQLRQNYVAECLDGKVWEVQTASESLICTFNPTNMATCFELVQLLINATGYSEPPKKKR